MDVVIDLETLGNEPENMLIVEVGLAIGDVKNPAIDPISFSTGLSVTEQILLGRKATKSTVNWWATQSSEARTKLINQDHSRTIAEFLIWLNEKILTVAKIHSLDASKVKVWGYGSSFDISGLESYLRQANFAAPWAYNRVRCARTLFNELKGCFPEIKKEEPTLAHSAEADAVAEYLTLVNCFAELNK